MVSADYSNLDGAHALSFLDLVEVMFVNAFREHGVHLSTIRRAAEIASHEFHSDHPFAKRTFLTDGKNILVAVARETGEEQLLDLVARQFEISEIVKPILRGDLEFGEFELANRWWPLGREGMIVVDPQRNFGQPIVESINVPCATLARSYESLGTVHAVADWYEIPTEAVQAAVSFENQLRAA